MVKIIGESINLLEHLCFFPIGTLNLNIKNIVEPIESIIVVKGFLENNLLYTNILI